MAGALPEASSHANHDRMHTHEGSKQEKKTKNTRPEAKSKEKKRVKSLCVCQSQEIALLVHVREPSTNHKIQGFVLPMVPNHESIDFPQIFFFFSRRGVGNLPQRAFFSFLACCPRLTITRILN